MITLELTKTLKNEILRILKNYDFDLNDFDWEPVGFQHLRIDYIVSKLNYIDNRYYFQFGCHRKGKYICEYSPGLNFPVYIIKDIEWGQVRNNVTIWGGTLLEEISKPDLWEEVHKYGTIFRIPSHEQITDEPFSDNEIEKIHNKLNELENKIEKLFNLNEEQKIYIQSQLDYLKDASNRTASIDSMHIMRSVFVNISTHLALNPEEALMLYNSVLFIYGNINNYIGT